MRKGDRRLSAVRDNAELRRGLSLFYVLEMGLWLRRRLSDMVMCVDMIYSSTRRDPFPIRTLKTWNYDIQMSDVELTCKPIFLTWVIK